MLQTLTKTQINDNSGVRIGQCIKVLKKSKKIGTVGDFIVISVKTLKKHSNLKIQKKNIFKALIINTKKEHAYKDSCFFKFDSNQIILLNNKNNLIGTRILGIVPKTLRKKNFIKFLTQASYLI
jgi:large subunit ribosomal protein L14